MWSLISAQNVSSEGRKKRERRGTYIVHGSHHHLAFAHIQKPIETCRSLSWWRVTRSFLTINEAKIKKQGE